MKTMAIGTIIVPDSAVPTLPSMEVAAIIDNYKKGDKVIVNINTTKNPEYYVGKVTKKSVANNLIYVRFDDGDTGQYKATSSQVGIIGHASKKKERKKPIKPANLHKWLKGHPDAPDNTKLVGKGTIKRPIKPNAAKKGKNVRAETPQTNTPTDAKQPDNKALNKDGHKVSVKKLGKAKKSKEGVRPMATKPNPAKVEEYQKLYRKYHANQMEIHMLEKYKPKADTSKLAAKGRQLSKEMVEMERLSGDPAGCAKARKHIIVYKSPEITERLEEKYAEEIKNYVPSWV